MAPNTLARSRIRHVTGWAHPHWYGPGIFSPVFYADGGDDPAPAGEPSVEPDTEPDDDPSNGWTPPTKDEWETFQQKLKTASAEAANRRKWLKAAGYDPKTGNKIDTDPEPGPEPEPAAAPEPQQQGPTPAQVQKQIDKAVAEAKIAGMRGAKKLATNFLGALSEAGWNGSRLDLIMPLSDLDGVDADDPEDLAERVEHVKSLFPEGFTPLKRTRNPATPSNSGGSSGQNGAPPAKVDTADKKTPAVQPKDWAEALAAQIFPGRQ
jgi:hypothetical protein